MNNTTLPGMSMCCLLCIIYLSNCIPLQYHGAGAPMDRFLPGHSFHSIIIRWSLSRSSVQVSWWSPCNFSRPSQCIECGSLYQHRHTPHCDWLYNACIQIQAEPDGRPATQSVLWIEHGAEPVGSTLVWSVFPPSREQASSSVLCASHPAFQTPTFSVSPHQPFFHVHTVKTFK